MLRKLEVENFMSLRRTQVDFRPFTVFIGPNGAGKSATFKALEALSKMLTSSPIRGDSGQFTLGEGVTLDDLAWGGNSGLPIAFRLWLDDNTSTEPDYSLEFRKDAAGWSVYREQYRTPAGVISNGEGGLFEFPTERRGIIRARTTATLRYQIWPHRNDSAAQESIAPIFDLTNRIGAAWRYRPSADDIARFARPPSESRGITVGANGAGLATELQRLQGEDRTTFTKIEEHLSQLFPHIRTIGFRPDYQGVRLTYMTNRSQIPVPAPQEADGVLLSTFLLWRLYSGGPNLHVCLEEPEGGMHPSLLKSRLQLLEDFTKASEDREHTLQISVATQSGRLAQDLIDRNFPCLRLAEFVEGNGTVVRIPDTYTDASNWAGQLW